MMPNILALETAMSACSVALLLNDQRHFSRFESAPRRHSEVILDFIDELIQEAGIALNELDAIAFGSGPGSFMGVRIAVAVAQGIAFGIDRPIIPVSSLQALAQTAYQKTKSERVLSAWDARMDAVYWGGYQLDQEGIMQMVIPDQLSTGLRPISLPDSSSWFAAGNAWAVYAPIHAVFRAIDSDIYPEAVHVAWIACRKFERGDVLEAEKAEPTYIREKVARKRGDD